MTQFRKTTTPLLFLDRLNSNGTPETALLSLITTADGPGLLSSARVVFRQGNGYVNIYQDDFSAFFKHDEVTVPTQQALDAQHNREFTKAAIAAIQVQVQQFYDERPAAPAVNLPKLQNLPVPYSAVSQVPIVL